MLELKAMYFCEIKDSGSAKMLFKFYPWSLIGHCPFNPLHIYLCWNDLSMVRSLDCTISLLVRSLLRIVTTVISMSISFSIYFQQKAFKKYENEWSWVQCNLIGQVSGRKSNQLFLLLTKPCYTSYYFCIHVLPSWSLYRPCRWQWCWWHRYIGDFMMVTDFRCWWQNHYVGDFSNVLNRSPTCWIGHQLRWNRKKISA